MALLIQLGITDVSLLRGYPKITHPKCIVVCIHLYAHTARLVLATVDSVEELPVVLHQTGIIIGQEYQGVNLETSLKTKPNLQHAENLSSELTSLRHRRLQEINSVRMRNDGTQLAVSAAREHATDLDCRAIVSFPDVDTEGLCMLRWACPHLGGGCGASLHKNIGFLYFSAVEHRLRGCPNAFHCWRGCSFLMTA